MLIHWIWFAQSKVSALQKRRLLEHFRDPEEIYYADAKLLSSYEGMSDAMCASLEQKDLREAQRIVDTCRNSGIRVLTFRDAEYPSRLRSICDSPIVLYVKGTIPDWDERPAIGVVGTRKASPYGRDVALQIGRQIAACGGLVISGAAAGIDGMAMLGALDAGKPVVGVLGCGVDVIYPKSNKDLFTQVEKSGCLISEYPPGSEPAGWHFPERNRIIAGICNGLLVVEAPEKSGALISARLALEQGRDVFAVPGNLGVSSSVGSNTLLQEGAKAVLNGWDVVRDYESLYPGKLDRSGIKHQTDAPLATVVQPVILPTADAPTTVADKKSIDKQKKSTYSVFDTATAQLSDDEKAVLSAIRPEGSLMDDIIAGSSLSPGAVKSILTKLALKRLIRQNPGGRVTLN